ncbi:unnamed protein product [Cyclocybe aegerita]|uniref:Peptidase A1 domain-containing protein n=1 Tax=Cyclocybe aegerita TaxID=1973307 RepID=A0A8S0VYZ8_CYCAE|nr:unnamed protein product [Cyclocybe aegerita]
MRSLIPLSLLLTVLDTPVHAAVFPFTVRFGHPAPSSLHRRAPVPIGNTGNAQYVSNITIGGVTLPVLLDTGSSDLWVHFPKEVPTMTDTGTEVSLSYAVGKATGNVQLADVSLGTITVQNQVLIHVVDTSTFTSDIHAQGYDGLIGLGPNESSVIRKKMKKADSSNTLVQRVFEANRSTENYITFLLDRKGDPGEQFKGQFTISEIVPGFENITSMPKLDVDKVNRLLKADQHWQALTDEDNGIIGPDGNAVTIDSIVPGAPEGQFVAVVDSGFTFSQVPREVSDAIYGRVRGAYYDEKNEWWLIPCGQYLNISFNFGGRNYPIHPLDVVDDNFSRVDPTGKKVCIGAFQPITSAFSVLGHYDMILGMSFLRNAYTLLDFGDWIKNSADKEHPYIQMASLTNVEAARQDFIQVRLGGNASAIDDARWTLLPVDQMQHSPISAEEKKKKYQEMILSRWPYIFVGCLVLVLIMIGLCVWKCCCKRRGNNNNAAGGAKKDFFSRGGGDSGKGDHLESGPRDSYAPLGGERSVGDLSKNPFSTPNSSHYNLNSPSQQHLNSPSGYDFQHAAPPYTAYPPDYGSGHRQSGYQDNRH